MTTPEPELLETLRRADWLAWPETRAVFAAFAARGHAARAVGGAVRDTLLGRPVNEIDLATEAAPETVMALAGEAGLKAVPTGIDHGTVTLIAGERAFEVTTLRKDVETYGRRARVAYTDDWEADARRRDFTINALYAGADGALFDPLGGLADVAARRVRFIGDPATRLREDFLRILRFFRFMAELETAETDPDGLAACVRERAGLDRLAPERVRVEVIRLLAGGGAAPALRRMYDYGLLAGLLGGVPRLPRLERLMALEQALARAGDPMLRLAALAVETREDAERLRRRFRLSNEESLRLGRAADWPGYAPDMSGNAAREALYRAGTEAYREAVLTAWASRGQSPDNADWRKLYALPERWTPPAFPLTGRDITALGVEEGPAVGELLAALEAEWIAGGFAAGREALLEKAKARAGGETAQGDGGDGGGGDERR